MEKTYNSTTDATVTTRYASVEDSPENRSALKDAGFIWEPNSRRWVGKAAALPALNDLKLGGVVQLWEPCSRCGREPVDESGLCYRCRGEDNRQPLVDFFDDDPVELALAQEIELVETAKPYPFYREGEENRVVKLIGTLGYYASCEGVGRPRPSGQMRRLNGIGVRRGHHTRVYEMWRDEENNFWFRENQVQDIGDTYQRYGFADEVPNWYPLTFELNPYYSRALSLFVSANDGTQ